MIHDDELGIMENIYSSNKRSHALIVYGEKGLGKRSSIQYFLQKKNNIIKISPTMGNSYQLESIVRALQLEPNLVLNNSDLSFEDQVKLKFLEMCRKNPVIIYVEHFQELDLQTAKFLLDTTQTLLNRFLDYQTYIIYELNIDEETNQLTVFYELPSKQTDFICFNRLSSEKLKIYFEDVLGKIEISKENLAYILDSSFGNIMYLNIAINYLKGERYIHSKNGHYICDKLPSGILADVLKDFILQRYNRLDDTLKEVLSKSSIIGNVFNAELLSKPFQIINADDMLRKIEKISQLIVHPDNISYTFENNDVYNLIKDSVSPEQQKKWHEVLANYYKKLLKKEQRRNRLKSIESEITVLYPLAKHYEYSRNYDSAIIYYLELISKYERISDYIHELKVLQIIKRLLEYVDLDKLHLDSLEYEVFKAEADCYRNLGNYPKACEAYDESLSYYDITEFSDSVIELLYYQAYCLYMNGEVDESMEILNPLRKHFEDQHICNHSYVKIIALLASICDANGDVESQKNYYLKALDFYKQNQCTQEYYVLLRMASMIFGEEIGVHMEETAEAFFRKQNYTRYLAETLHNIATDYLYIGELSKIYEPINEAIKLFDSFGSVAVHYSLNNKGIFIMIADENYESAITVFDQALQYKMEPYSEIAIRINILNCVNRLGYRDKAIEQLQKIDELIESQNQQYIPVYKIYQHLNWAFYYFHIKDYDKCLQNLKICSRLEYMEPRFRYIYKTLMYKTKKHLGIAAHNMAGTAPLKVYEKCLKNDFYFATLRFYESL